METMPSPLDALAAQHGGLDDFRVDAPREIAAMLKQLSDGNVRLNLNASDGTVLAATLWTHDAARDKLSFSVDARDSRLPALLECDEAVVVGYLDSVKVQFDVSGLVLVHGGAGSVLSATFPRQLFRFQRRGGYRVRPLLSNAPLARLRHPDIADVSLALRVLDLSIGGCALSLPDDVPALPLGVIIHPVRVELDVDTHVVVSLRLQHVTAINPAARGARLGCEFVKPDGDTTRTLQRFIDQTQKRRKLMALG
jgi:flagellar brake protein